jgi:hypothetical protein
VAGEYGAEGALRRVAGAAIVDDPQWLDRWRMKRDVAMRPDVIRCLIRTGAFI